MSECVCRTSPLPGPRWAELCFGTCTFPMADTESCSAFVPATRKLGLSKILKRAKMLQTSDCWPFPRQVPSPGPLSECQMRTAPLLSENHGNPSPFPLHPWSPFLTEPVLQEISVLPQPKVSLHKGNMRVFSLIWSTLCRCNSVNAWIFRFWKRQTTEDKSVFLFLPGLPTLLVLLALNLFILN